MKNLLLLSIFSLAFLTNCCSAKPSKQDVDLSLKPSADDVSLTSTTLSVINDTRDPKHPTVTFLGEINSETANQFNTAVMTDLGAGAENITIKFSSVGGSIVAGATMITVLNAAQVPTTCIAVGDDMSMAFYITQTCTEREAMPGSRLMTHEIHSTVENGTRYGLQTEADQLKVMSLAENKQIAARMHMPLEVYNEKVKDKEWFMDADEACDNYAIDSIVDRDGKIIRVCKVPDQK